MNHENEEELLRSAALQNARSILLARQRAEEALRKQSEWTRVTLASIGDGVISTDTDGRVTFMNSMAETLTGWLQAEALGLPLEDVFHIVNAGTFQPVENPALRALKEGTVVALANHTLLIARDGKERPIDDSAAPIRDALGTPIGAVLVFRDITERSQAEESRALLAAIVESSDDAIISKTLDGVIRSWNAAAERIFGYSKVEAIGQSITLIIPADLQEEERMILARLRRGERIDHFETVRISKDGRRLDISLTVSPLRDHDGHITGASKVARDITGRKRAERLLQQNEEYLRTVFETTPACVKIVAADGTLVDMNSRGLAMVEANRLEAVKGKSIYELISEKDRDKYRAFHERVCQGVKGTLEFEIIGLNGSTRLLESHAAPLRGLDGCFMHLAITQDITDRKQVEEAMRQSEARKTAILETALDCIITCDHHGAVVEFNPAAEQTFGYTRAEVIGRDLANLIIPPRLRERHRNGIAHYVATREGPILNRRIEMPAQRADGTEFPTELAVIQIPTDGAPEFTAYLRDITARKDRELRRVTRLAIVQILAEADTVELAVRRLLQTVCEALKWDVGAMWLLDEKANVLRCLDAWHQSSKPGLNLVAACRQLTFLPGIGLPGEVWNKGHSVWIPDFTNDDSYPRASIARQDGLHAAFGCPIVLGNQVLGVMEFFSHEVREPNADLLEMMSTLGGQIGHFIERRRAQEALRESEAQFRQLADSLPQIVWTARPDGFIDYYNERWYQFTGYSRDDFGDQSWKPILHPDDVQRCADTYYGCIRSGNLYQIEYRFKNRETGGYRWFLGRAHPVRDEQGRIVRWLGTCTDIDDTKRAEETTRFLADASTALAELTDYESTLQKVAGLAVPFFADWCTVDIQQADGSIRRLAVTHSDPAKVQLAQELTQRTFPRPAALQGIMKVIRSGEPDWVPKITESHLKNLIQDEELHQIILDLGLKSYICVPLRTRDKVFGALTFVMAESGRAYGADALRAAQDLAQRAVIAIENANLLSALKDMDRRKDEFLAMLAHELRNPLAPMRNALDVMRADGRPGQQLQWARDVIGRQMEQLTRLVDDLLDVSRITRGKIELRKERVQLATVVDSAIEATRPLIDERRHDLKITLPTEPVYLDADPLRLAQVLLNLLNNAAKYTEPGGRIWLTSERVGDQVWIRIKDTGIGISAETLPHVFEMFAQADASMERSQGGLGIGLTLVQRLVELHGGTVSSLSAGSGKGSEFVVRLPIAGAAGATSTIGAAGDTDKAASSIRYHILVVDDNKDAADGLARLLRMMGHDVHTAYDGLAAVGDAAVLQPDVIILDIGLPKLNGYDAARRIREDQGADVVLIALTGWGQERDRRRSKDAGFDHHLTKPIEFAALQSLLASLKLPQK